MASTSTGLNALGIVVSEQGRFAEALAIGRRAPAMRERQLGPAHPALLVTLDASAVVLRGLGQETEAAGLESRARQLRAAR